MKEMIQHAELNGSTFHTIKDTGLSKYLTSHIEIEF